MHPKTERKMELRQLKYFVKVAELSSFSEASRQLNITQSTISQQIKQLEDELQVSLLIRTSHGVTVSDMGKAFLPQAKRTLREAESCIDRIHDVQQLGVGELNIGTTPTFTPLLRETVQQFMRRYPGVIVHIFCYPMETLMSMLDKQEIDLALSYKSTSAYPNIESHILFDNQLAVIVDESHPLTQHSSLRLSDLEKYPLALPAKGMQARNAFDRIIDGKDYRFNICFEINEVNLLMDVVRGTRLVTLLSEATAKRMAGVVAIPLDQQGTNMEGSFHVKRDVYRKNATKEFLRMLCENRPYGLAMMNLL